MLAMMLVMTKMSMAMLVTRWQLIMKQFQRTEENSDCKDGKCNHRKKLVFDYKAVKTARAWQLLTGIAFDQQETNVATYLQANWDNDEQRPLVGRDESEVKETYQDDGLMLLLFKTNAETCKDT